MAFAGLKKQINKANQYVTERMGGAEGTRLDNEFMEMERKTDVTNELVEELQVKTREYLQPNPNARAKMAAVKGISKLSGQAKANTYPQPEGVLGDCMSTFGKKLGEDSHFAQALVEFGESLKLMADIKYSLDDNVKQNVLEPLHALQMKDLKEVMHHRKKLQGRRLDFDCKRRKQSKGSHITDDEIKHAEEKFAESLQHAQIGMHHLLSNDIEQISQLCTFAECMHEYHQQCTEILKDLVQQMQEKREEAANEPRPEFVPKTLTDLNIEPIMDGLNGANSFKKPPPYSQNPPPSRHSTNDANNRASVPSFGWNVPPAIPSPLPSPMRSPARTPMNQTPCCKALYDFDAQNPGELEFKEGDNITLVTKVDENWYEGSVNGKTGYFPQNYVQVVVPLP